MLSMVLFMNKIDFVHRHRNVQIILLQKKTKIPMTAYSSSTETYLNAISGHAHHSNDG